MCVTKHHRQKHLQYVTVVGHMKPYNLVNIYGGFDQTYRLHLYVCTNKCTFSYTCPLLLTPTCFGHFCDHLQGIS